MPRSPVEKGAGKTRSYLGTIPHERTEPDHNDENLKWTPVLPTAVFFGRTPQVKPTLSQRNQTLDSNNGQKK
jgi:hypothetical protein